MTKLEKLSDDDKLKLCRQYFYIGLAFLPFMWFVNFVWFFHIAFLKKPHFPQQAGIRRFATLSGVGALLWLAALIIWVVIFQTHRVSWGATGDYLSLVFPKGYA